MPKYGFLPETELRKSTYIYAYSLDEKESKEWLDKCGAIEKKTGYFLIRRTSSISLLMIYLMAEKGFSVDQIVDLDKMPKEELLKNMDDFLKFIDDPNLDAYGIIERIGSMERKFLEKIVTYKVPDMGEIKSISDLVKIQKHMYVLGNLCIDFGQDSSRFTAKDVKDPKKKEAFFKGTNGTKAFNRMMSSWAVFSKAFSEVYKPISDPGVKPIAKAMCYEYAKNFFAKYGGNEINNLPLRKTLDMNNIPPQSKAYASDLSAKKAKEANDEQEKSAIEYLEGKSQTYEGQEAANQYLKTTISYNGLNLAIEAEMEELSSRILGPYLQDLGKEDLATEDLTKLPEETKRKMLKIYENIFGKFYRPYNMIGITDLGLSEFDLIKNTSGKSIKQLAGNKYNNLNLDMQDEAMKLETVRAFALEKDGLRAQYAIIHEDDKIEIVAPTAIKKIPERIIIRFNDKITAQIADDYRKKADHNNVCARAGNTISGKMKDIFATQEDLMKKYGLTPYDCIFVGGKTLREIYNEKHDPKEKINSSNLYGFLVAASMGSEPVFATAISEVNGNLRRTPIPIAYSGDNVTREQSKLAVTEKTIESAKNIIRNLPLRTPIVTKNLEDINSHVPNLNAADDYFKTVVAIYGARPVKVPELIEKGVYTEEAFNANYIAYNADGVSNSEFATIAYFASMVEGSKKKDSATTGKNELGNSEKVTYKHDYRADDICAQDGFPKSDFFNTYVNIGINPGRKAAFNAVSASRNDYKPLAELLAKGIKEQIKNLKNLKDLKNVSKSDGLFMHIINMIDHANRIVEFRGAKLQKIFESQFTSEELNMFKILLKLKKLADAKFHSEQMLNRSEKNEIQLTEDEKQLCRSQIEKYNSLTTKLVNFSDPVLNNILNEEILTETLWSKHNPIDMKFFDKGKYGKINGFSVLRRISPDVKVAKNILGEELFKEYDDILGSISTGMPFAKVETVVPIYKSDNTTNIAFSPDDNLRFYNVMKKIHIAYVEKLKNPTDDMKPFLGKYKIIADKFNPDINLSEAEMDSPYILTLESLLANSLNEHTYGTKEIVRALSEKTDPVTGKKAPYEYIAEYYDNLAELIHLQVEKQELAANPSPEKEKQYLKKLVDAHNKYIENMEQFTEFNKTVVDPTTGKSEYDKYFQNGLDMFTGTSLVNKEANRRSPYRVIGWMQGINKAVENGWGINELNVLGGIGAMELLLKRNLTQYKLDNDPQLLAEGVKSEQEKLKENQSALQENEKKLATAKTEEEKVKINEEIQYYNSRIANHKKTIELRNLKIKQFSTAVKAITSLQDELAVLKNESWDTNVRDARDKKVIIDKFNGFLHKLESEAKKHQFNSHVDEVRYPIEVVKKAVEDEISSAIAKDPFLGRKLMDIPNDIADDKFIAEQYNYYNYDKIIYLLKENFLSKQNAPGLYDKVVEGHNNIPDLNGGKGVKSDDVIGFSNRYMVTKHLLNKNGVRAERISQHLDPSQNAEIDKLMMEVHDGYKKYIDKLPENHRIFRPCMEVMLNSLDVSKGNLLRAKADNEVVGILYGTGNFGPALFREPGIDKNMSRDAVKTGLAENGTLLSQVEYYDGVAHVISAEFKKQQDMKNGWDKEKEARYLFNLKKAYDKIIKNYEEMMRAPMEVQNEVGRYNEDSVGDITGIPYDRNRGLLGHIESMRWQIQALKNGWGARNINLASQIGDIEGLIAKRIIRNEQKIEGIKENIEKIQDESAKKAEREKIKSYEENIKELENFRREKWEPFKRNLWNKRVSGPEDMLDVLNKVEGFIQDNIELDVVKNNGLLDNINPDGNYTIADINNRTIEDVKNAKKDPKLIEGKYGPVELEERENLSRGIAKQIRGSKDVSKLGAVAVVIAYIKEEYLSQLYKADYPQYFDEKRPDYKLAHRILDLELEKYSKEIIESMAPDKNEPQAENSAKKDSKYFTVDGDKLSDILQFGHHGIFFGKLEDEVNIRMKNHAEKIFTNGILKINEDKKSLNEMLEEGLEAIDAAPETLTTTNVLLEAYMDIKKLIGQKKKFDAELKKKREEGKDCTLDPEKFAKFKKDVNAIIGGILKYTNKKDKRREQKGGNLGKVGEARYDAMKKALDGMIALKHATEIYENKGPSAEELVHDAGKYGVDFKATEKYAEYRGELYKQDMEEVLSNVNKLVEAQNDKFKQYSADIKANEKKIVHIAIDSLFISAVKTKYAAETKCVGLNEEKLKGFIRTMGDFVKNKSTQYNTYKRELMSNADFMKEFSKQVVDSVSKGKYAPEDIENCKNAALRKVAEMNKQQQPAKEKVVNNSAVNNPNDAAKQNDKKAGEIKNNMARK